MTRLREFIVSFPRLMAAGRRVFPRLLLILGGIVVLWVLVQQTVAPDTVRYAHAVFIGAFLGTAMVTTFLATSRDLEDLANVERRLAHERAVVALVFDIRGRVLLHLQPTHRATSWPEYWVPPGGMLEDGASGDAARERLRTLVDDKHPWGRAVHLATTEKSSAYRRMNKREEQVPVQVEAFWVKWSEETAWAPEGAFDDLGPSSLRPAGPDDLPDPMPPYYPELIRYLDAVRRGVDAGLEPLNCWTTPEAHAFAAEWRKGH